VADTSATNQRTAADEMKEIELRKQAAEAERQRGIDIRAQVRAAGLDEDVADDMVARGITADSAAREILQKLIEQDKKADTRSQTRIETMVDETETRRAAMTEAIVHRIAPRGELPERAREFRHMSLLRMAEESLSAQGIRVRGLAPLEIASRALHSTSDFPHILANVMNKRLRAGYDENVPSYTMWARRAPNAPDFKTLSVVQLSAMPDLLAKAESGEFKYGTLSDGKETYSMLSYGRILGVTRETLINDDLRAFDRIAAGFSASARRLENRMVYAQITGNPNMGDGVALFHGSHGNLAGSGAAISATTLGAGRTAMRLQKGLQAEELNLAPRFLIVPATQEQLAYQYTSTQFVPAKSSDVNEFRQGGRTALEPIVEAILDGSSTTAWYLAGDTGQVDTVEYCYLDGAEGVRLETAMEFDTDGMKVKAALDFVAKVIDHRGLYKNAGA
jgi:polyhydroxyalkanoate synthesis regulator phasin